MSGQGAPEQQAVAGGESLRVVVVASQWHGKVMAGLMSGARRALDDSGVVDVRVVQVPGAFELPVAASRIAGGGVDAIVALGVVIRGDTPHFEYVCAAATDGLRDVAVRTGIPVGFGVLTCDDENQAILRAGLPDSKEDKGYEAAQAALVTALALTDFPRH
jgi:6,7-dimethyl-8-ribityllumazine synthase